MVPIHLYGRSHEDIAWLAKNQPGGSNNPQVLLCGFLLYLVILVM